MNSWKLTEKKHKFTIEVGQGLSSVDILRSHSTDPHTDKGLKNSTIGQREFRNAHLMASAPDLLVALADEAKSAQEYYSVPSEATLNILNKFGLVDVNGTVLLPE